jgi:hypothetical protein
LQRRQKPFGCGNFSVVGPLKGQPGKFGHKSLFCQSYRCRRCRNPKLKKVRARIAQIATEHKLTRMATLTLDPKRIPKGKQTDRYLRECWNEMRVSLARKFGKSIPYVGVLEFHKSGIAHLHLLVGQYIAQKWLSEAWYGIGGGRIVDIRYVDVHRVSAYLSVYLAGDKVQKTLELLPKRARIFTTARSIVLWGRKKKSGWCLRRMSLSELVNHAENPTNLRFTAVDDLKAFGLEIFSYFESPPFAVATDGQEAFDVIRKSWRIWAQKVSHGKPGEVVKLKPKGKAETL